MKTKARITLQLFGAWSALFYIAALVIGWWLFAGYLPPHNPELGASQISDFYLAHPYRIKIGMIFEMFAAAFMIPLTAAITKQIILIEGEVGMLAISQIMGGVGNVFLTFYPAMWWIVASFRPERSPELILLLNDVGWLQFVGGSTPFFAIVLSIAIAAFNDDSEQPAFPRWFGYLNLWVFVLLLPTQLIFFYKSGPFAWNGLFSFWVPLLALATWFVSVFILLRSAVLRQSTMSR